MQNHYKNSTNQDQDMALLKIENRPAKKQDEKGPAADATTPPFNSASGRREKAISLFTTKEKVFLPSSSTAGEKGKGFAASLALLFGNRVSRDDFSLNLCFF